jgi:hypothetical protein
MLCFENNNQKECITKGGFLSEMLGTINELIFQSLLAKEE